MSLDFSVIGIVFAIILLIIFFSAVVLYLSFRIKETFRKETRRGSTIIKIAFLIGILFLAGGLFYFFANTFTNVNDPSVIPTPTPTGQPTPTPSSTPSQSPILTLSVSAPSQVGMTSQFSVSFTISNPTSFTATGVYLDTDNLFSDFEFQTSTHDRSGSVITLGDVSSGVTVVTVTLFSPDRARTYTNTITLNFQEMIIPVTESIVISTRGN